MTSFACTALDPKLAVCGCPSYTKISNLLSLLSVFPSSSFLRTCFKTSSRHCCKIVDGTTMSVVFEMPGIFSPAFAAWQCGHMKSGASVQFCLMPTQYACDHL